MVNVKSRIEDNVSALKNFKEKREDGKTRADYMALLRKDLMYYYGYNHYLVERFSELIPIDQLIAFFESNEVQRPTTIRTNTLKARRRELAQVGCKKVFDENQIFLPSFDFFKGILYHLILFTYVDHI